MHTTLADVLVGLELAGWCFTIVGI